MDETLSLSFFIPTTEAEGPGRRFALWAQGCTLACPGCCNPEMWPKEGGERHEVTALLDAIEAVRERIEGVSFLGGEPFQQERALAHLAAEVRARDLTVMVFSGYTLAELRARGGPLLEHVDLLVAGRYERALRTTRRRWIGSQNQQLHFLTDAYDPEDPRFAEPNHAEIKLNSKGELTVVGFPFDKILEAFPKKAAAWRV